MSLEEEIPKRFKIAAYEDGPLKGLCFEPFAALTLRSIPWRGLKQRPDPRYRLEKSSHSRRVVSFEWSWDDPQGGQRRRARLYVKQAKVLRWIGRALSLFRQTKAKREWRLELAMREAGIPAPFPVLFAESRRFGMARESFLATLELERAAPFQDEFRRLRVPAQRLAALEALACFLRAGHERGFYHDDCSSAHVFVRDGLVETGAHERMAFIDVDNGRLMRRVPERLRVRNSFQIFRSLEARNLSFEEKAAFLQALFDRTLSAEEAARYLGRIGRWAWWKAFRKRFLKALPF